MSEIHHAALLAGARAGANYALRAPRNLPVGSIGSQHGARAGSSLEFREHRDYEPGDDLRHIDWNAFSRSDHLVVKLFQEEVTPYLDLIVDCSRSMDLEGSRKAEATLALAGFFAVAAENAGFAHRVWLIKDGCRQLEQGTAHPEAWPLPTFDHAGHVGDSFARQPPALRPKGLRIFISDLFWLGDPMQVLPRCAENATALVVLQVLAAADVDPGERGNLRLVDAETEQTFELRMDGPAVERYQAALERHQKNWHDACRRAGAFMSSLVAEELLRDWRMDELVNGEILQVVG